MSTLALEGSDGVSAGRGATAVRYVDLLLLAAGLVVFWAADLPMLAYGVVAGIWLVQLAIERFAEARAARSLAAGDRRTAMGWVGATTLGRVWLVALTVLLVGLLAEREAGLAAAVLAAILFTAHLGGRLLARLLGPEQAGGGA